MFDRQFFNYMVVRLKGLFYSGHGKRKWRYLRYVMNARKCGDEGDAVFNKLTVSARYSQQSISPTM
jgi:hypothetical protein